MNLFCSAPQLKRDSLGSAVMSVRITYDDALPTQHQLAVAERIRQVLDTRVLYDRVVKSSTGNGPSIEFMIRTTKAGLSVRLAVYQDSFHVLANEAEFQVELVEPDQYDAWADKVVELTTRLLSGPLRIRVRHPFLKWFRPEGSVFLSAADGGTWNGALSGRAGREQVFEDWYEPRQGHQRA